jgi:hypothetical protein
MYKVGDLFLNTKFGSKMLIVEPSSPRQYFVELSSSCCFKSYELVSEEEIIRYNYNFVNNIGVIEKWLKVFLWYTADLWAKIGIRRQEDGSERDK